MILNPILPIWLLIMVIGGLGAVAIWKGRGLTRVAQVGCLIVMLIIGLRPMHRNGETASFHNNVDVFFVVDNTLSMLAEDYDGTKQRMEGVVTDIERIIEDVPGANYALISFANYSAVNLPPTPDTKALMTAAKTLRQTEAFDARGTTVTMFKDDLERLLKSSAEKEHHQRIVIIMSDGENTSEEKIESLGSLKEYVDGGMVLGYGTSTGAGMKVDKYGEGKYEYLEDTTVLSGSSFPRAISKIDEGNLKTMAEDLGVKYLHAPASDDEMKAELGKVDLSEMITDESITYAYDDLYYYFVPILAALMMWNSYLIKERRPA